MSAPVPSGAVAIRVGPRHDALVDAADEALARSRTWSLYQSASGRVLYARSVGRPRVRLHRFLLDAKPGEIIDHVNFDGLDNRRSNLRIATLAESLRHRRGFGPLPKGVHRSKSGYCARIEVDGQRCHLGTFRSANEAAAAYDRAALLVHGEYAALNRDCWCPGRGAA